MTRNLFIFVGTFVVGALLALITRAALHEPHEAQEVAVAAGGEYAAMVGNALVPAGQTPAGTTRDTSAPAEPVPADAHAGHGSGSLHEHGGQPERSAAGDRAAPTGGKPVNTVCAICGMAVNEKLPTLEYQGKVIGFGCKMCAPKFKADPDRYGPHYLRNEVIKR